MASTIFKDFSKPAINAEWLNGVDKFVYQGVGATSLELAALQTLYSSSNGANNVGYTQGSSGSAPRTVQDKSKEIVSVLDFFANGVSGPRVDPTNVLDSTLGIQKAIDSLPPAGGTVIVPAGTYRLDSTLVSRGGVILVGMGSQSTVLNYTGNAQAYVQATPGVRVFGLGIRGLRINNTGSGTIGLDLNSVSSGKFDDVVVNGFPTSFSLAGPNGFCVYNRFYNTTAQNATTGYKIGGSGSNSNSFIACRVNLATTGFDIVDSNQNQIAFGQIEGATTGVLITSTIPNLADHNSITFNRFEGCTTNYNITSSNVRDTVTFGNHGVTGTSINNSPRAQLFDIASGTTPNMLVASAAPANSGGAFRFVRLSQGGTGLPAVVFRDDAAAGGTPTTVQVETERLAGKFFSGLRGGAEYSYLDAQGRLMLSGSAPTVGAGQLGLGATTATTVGAGGGAAALPTTPLGYLIINIAGTNVKVPYYSV